MSRILIIDGHPSRNDGHFCAALAAAYETGAQDAGHRVQRLHIARLEFPLLRNPEDWTAGPVPEPIKACQSAIAEADHLVLIYPLWLGCMPALFKGFLEQVLRPGFAFEETSATGFPRGKLRDKSARIVVTMGMPAFIYRWYFGAHGLKVLKRNILRFVGIWPIRSSIVGLVGAENPLKRQRWLDKMRSFGRSGI